MMQNNFYIYGWYYLDNSVETLFYIGKGKDNRFQITKQRNTYFTSIVKKYDTFSKILISDLTEEESWELEELLIDELKEVGLCKANFMRGGRGGNTRQFMTEDIKKDLIKRQVATFKSNYKKENHPLYNIKGESNPNFGRKNNIESNKKISKALKGKQKSLDHKKNLSISHKNKKLTEKHKQNISIAVEGKNNGRTIKFQILINNFIYTVFGKKNILSLLKEHNITNLNSKNEIIKSIGTINKIIKNKYYEDLKGNKVEIIKL